MSKGKISSGIIGGVFVAILGTLGIFGAIKYGGVKVEFPKKPSEPSIKLPDSTLDSLPPIEKNDYYALDLSNNSNAIPVTAANLNQLLKIDSEAKLSVSPLAAAYVTADFDGLNADNQNLYLDKGGLRFGTSSKQGILKLNFKTHYDHVVVTGSSYNAPVYVDPENGVNVPLLDENGNKIPQKWSCDFAELEVLSLPNGDIDSWSADYKFLTNNGEVRAPETTTIDIDLSVYSETGVSLRSSEIDGQEAVEGATKTYQRFIITKIELWNN